MTFSLESLKDSLHKMDMLVEKENRIWIEDLNLPEWFDSRTCYVYLPGHMKEMFKEALPSFIRFSEVSEAHQMYIIPKHMVSNDNQWGDLFK